MEILAIGKPAINVYIPLQEFPEEGDLFLIKNKNESVGNVAATSSCLLAKWGVANHFTGVIGNDGYANIVKDTFKKFNIEDRYIEIDYENNTAVNYDILNVKSGVVTKILYNNPDSYLKKYKYDFNPDFAIIDGTDYAGAHALINNNANVKTIFYGRIGDKDAIAISKRCTYAIVTEKFVEMLTHDSSDGSAGSYVRLYQKIVDSAGNSNFIVILNNHKILYSVDGKVKMLPEMKINVVDYSSFDSIFVGAFAYALINNKSIDDAIKIANTASAMSLGKIGEVDAIPELNDVLNNCGLQNNTGVNSSVEAIKPLNPISNESQTQTTNNQTNAEQTSVNNINQPEQSVNQVNSFQSPLVNNPVNQNNGIPNQNNNTQSMPNNSNTINNNPNV